MSKYSVIFKIVYIINLIIIIGALLYPIGMKLLLKTSLEELSLSYTFVILLLGVSFCISFLLINIWGIILNKSNRLYYIIAAVVLLIWVIWSILQFSYGVMP